MAHIDVFQYISWHFKAPDLYGNEVRRGPSGGLKGKKHVIAIPSEANLACFSCYFIF